MHMGAQIENLIGLRSSAAQAPPPRFALNKLNSDDDGHRLDAI